jgi:hypothetical protein
MHLLCCSCENECSTNHDMLQDTIVTIITENEPHIQRGVSHLFSCHTWKRMGIVIIINDFQILTNVVIIDSTCIDLI